MTYKGEVLTQKGEINGRIFNINRKISLGFPSFNNSSHSLEKATDKRPASIDLKMIFVLKGNLKGFNGSQNLSISLQDQQHNLLLDQNSIHWEAEKDSDIFCLAIDYSFLLKYLPADHQGLIRIEKGVSKNEPAVFSIQNLHVTPEILTILSSLKTSTHTGFCERLFLEAKVLELLMFQSSQFEQLNSSGPLRQLKEEEMNKMQEVKNILVDSLDNQFTLRTLAHMVGTNEFSLKRNFKIAFGTTVYGYLNQHKMEMAKSMLLENDVTIAETATKMGYKYPTHFSNAFKKYFGYLPNKLKSSKLPLLIFIEEFSVLFENMAVFIA